MAFPLRSLPSPLKLMLRDPEIYVRAFFRYKSVFRESTTPCEISRATLSERPSRAGSGSAAAPNNVKSTRIARYDDGGRNKLRDANKRNVRVSFSRRVDDTCLFKTENTMRALFMRRSSSIAVFKLLRSPHTADGNYSFSPFSPSHS